MVVFYRKRVSSSCTHSSIMGYHQPKEKEGIMVRYTKKCKCVFCGQLAYYKSTREFQSCDGCWRVYDKIKKVIYNKGYNAGKVSKKLVV